ncbi:uncharacterized protein LOC113866592 [Abrus precatorius]|uniref:Uncharacterized protein LOC113866592 n=1 Tax=Abrus precatorius TaxID=3816 RepID=A0A8B8LMQ9_ABRPR|nr:uncharacterized protein LOC113866592 [Abrus precatorius]
MRHDRKPPRFFKGPYSGLSKSHSRGSSSQEKSSSGSGSGTSSFRGPIKCFRYGGPHMLRDCPHLRTNCRNCGKLRHTANVCWSLKKSGSTSSAQRPESRRSTGPSTGLKPSILRRVFAMSRAKASHLNLYITELPCNVVVTTSTGKPVVTSWVCLGYAIMVHGRKFEVDLICLPLSQLDVILGMDWLAANHVLLDCREKTLIFGASMLEVSRLLSHGAWENAVEAKAFMVMFSMEAESVVELECIPVVREFLEVFPKDVSELPPEREIEFTIDLILGASPISMAPYRMSPVELAEVKKQVEDLL